MDAEQGGGAGPEMRLIACASQRTVAKVRSVGCGCATPVRRHLGRRSRSTVCCPRLEFDGTAGGDACVQI